MNDITPEEHHALELFATRLRQEFPGRLGSLRLFGSKARGEATKFSDLDVLVILDNATWQDRRIVSRLTSRILLETEVVISPKTFSPEQFETMKQHRSMFWQSIEPDLIPLP